MVYIVLIRYMAIVQPLEYTQSMTRSLVVVMLTVAWAAPLSISVLPIFTGWYATKVGITLSSYCQE